MPRVASSVPFRRQRITALSSSPIPATTTTTTTTPSYYLNGSASSMNLDYIANVDRLDATQHHHQQQQQQQRYSNMNVSVLSGSPSNPIVIAGGGGIFDEHSFALSSLALMSASNASFEGVPDVITDNTPAASNMAATMADYFESRQAASTTAAHAINPCIFLEESTMTLLSQSYLDNSTYLSMGAGFDAAAVPSSLFLSPASPTEGCGNVLFHQQQENCDVQHQRHHDRLTFAMLTAMADAPQPSDLLNDTSQAYPLSLMNDVICAAIVDSSIAAKGVHVAKDCGGGDDDEEGRSSNCCNLNLMAASPLLDFKKVKGDAVVDEMTFADADDARQIDDDGRLEVSTTAVFVPPAAPTAMPHVADEPRLHHHHRAAVVGSGNVGCGGGGFISRSSSSSVRFFDSSSMMSASATMTGITTSNSKFKDCIVYLNDRSSIATTPNTKKAGGGGCADREWMLRAEENVRRFKKEEADEANADTPLRMDPRHDADGDGDGVTTAAAACDTQLFFSRDTTPSKPLPQYHRQPHHRHCRPVPVNGRRTSLFEEPMVGKMGTAKNVPPPFDLGNETTATKGLPARNAAAVGLLTEDHPLSLLSIRRVGGARHTSVGGAAASATHGEEDADDDDGTKKNWSSDFSSELTLLTRHEKGKTTADETKGEEEEEDTIVVVVGDKKQMPMKTTNKTDFNNVAYLSAATPPASMVSSSTDVLITSSEFSQRGGGASAIAHSLTTSSANSPWQEQHYCCRYLSASAVTAFLSPPPPPTQPPTLTFGPRLMACDRSPPPEFDVGTTPLDTLGSYFNFRPTNNGNTNCTAAQQPFCMSATSILSPTSIFSPSTSQTQPFSFLFPSHNASSVCSSTSLGYAATASTASLTASSSSVAAVTPSCVAAGSHHHHHHHSCQCPLYHHGHACYEDAGDDAKNGAFVLGAGSAVVGDASLSTITHEKRSQSCSAIPKRNGSSPLVFVCGGGPSHCPCSQRIVPRSMLKMGSGLLSSASVCESPLPSPVSLPVPSAASSNGAFPKITSPTLPKLN